MICKDYNFWGRYFFDKMVQAKVKLKYPLKGEEVLDWEDLTQEQQRPYKLMAKEVDNDLDLDIDKVLPF